MQCKNLLVVEKGSKNFSCTILTHYLKSKIIVRLWNLRCLNDLLKVCDQIKCLVPITAKPFVGSLVQNKLFSHMKAQAVFRHTPSSICGWLEGPLGPGEVAFLSLLLFIIGYNRGSVIFNIIIDTQMDIINSFFVNFYNFEFVFEIKILQAQILEGYWH